MFRRSALSSIRSGGGTSRRSALILLGTFVVLSLAAGLAGRLYYDQQASLIQRQKQEELDAIGRLKVDQIAQWRARLSDDARQIATDTHFTADVAAWSTERAAGSGILETLEAFVRYRAYDEAILVTADGRYVTTGASGSASPDLSIGARASASAEPVISDLQKEPSGRVVLDVAIALPSVPGAVVILRAAPEDFLYPLIQSWPTPSASAETLLVRREGDKVLFLNDLRFRSDAALTLTVPMSSTSVLAVQAVSGKLGVRTGTDYRGVSVLGATERVPGTDWYLVAKMDQSEAFAPMASAARTAMAGVALLVAMIGLGVGLAWRIQLVGEYRERLRIEEERNRADEKYRYLSRYANDAVLLLDTPGGRILEANDRACDMYGYSHEELLAMTNADLRALEQRDGAEPAIESILAAGSAVMETQHARKDGSRIWVEISARAIGDADARQIVGVVRDITERKASQAALEASEEKFRQFFELSPVAMSMTRPTGEIDVNQAFLDMLGYTREEIADHATWQSLSHPDDVEASNGVIAAIMAGEAASVRFGKRYLRKDGAVVWGEVSTTLRRHDDGTPDYFMTTILDVTEQTVANERLGESERALRALFDNMSQGFAVHDIILDDDGNPCDYRFVAVNPGFEQMTGLRGEDIVGRTVLDVLPGTERSWIDRYGRVALTGTPILFENYSAALRKWFEVVAYSPGPKRFATIFSDVTARKAQEEELKAHRQHLEALVEDRTQELAATNEELRSVNEELAATNEELQSVNEELAATIEELQSVNEELTATNEELAVTNDEVSRQADEIRRVNEELRAATAAKSEFLANMSHELRTPLNSIIGFTGVMLQGLTGELNGEQQSQLVMVRRSGDRLLALINDILDLSRIESGRVTVSARDTDLESVVRAAVDTVRPLAEERGLGLRLTCASDGVVVRTDEQKLHQVLVNLLANAIKFTDAGSVTLEVDTDGQGAAVFRVSDTGVGIAPADLSAIFDEFVQIPHDGGKPEGTGLGLAISRRLADLLGGDLTATSTVGEGSTFTLTIPREFEGPRPTRASRDGQGT